MFLSKFVKPKNLKICSLKLLSDARKETFVSNELEHLDEQFKSIPKEDRSKITFHAVLAAFRKNNSNLRGSVEFITTALKHMKDFNLHKDLDTYKALLDSFPKGPLIPQTKAQKIFLHFPQHQNCCIKVLDEMEWNGVQPDKDVHEIVALTFGQWNFATKKIKRMLYWMPKIRHTNKYLDKREIDNKKLNAMELAELALKMMSRDAGTKISDAQSVDKNGKVSFIVSAQSPLQKRLLFNLVQAHSDNGLTLNIDGPSLVYLSDHKIKYVVLSCDDPEYRENESTLLDNDSYYNLDDIVYGIEKEFKKTKNIHQQGGKVILALAVLEDNSRESAMAWMKHLQEDNPNLEKATILFRLKTNDVDVI
ncbi:Evolutionarily conserved signaling intermediate in Toll pathway, mitochondrial [Strongyloides ratti]|uniref:Evolutionarily conserved signaling intermediate in Toll pathway, mitochondrial n=1 Tax=Strongyloides ratti TaxID=34506 RepID=A0A090N081_STRRB|nr:Evolutionarily conserved signaling intermediate in Toll pathway, mitochondrial [Strongyloides ratti]CEF70225.1 Evolutionarily conserved signaling intermediate in Toll pathway, mitochondrial [Strongyloides ratti]